MTSAAIDVEGVRHAYKAKPALAGLDFQVPRGARYALLGPNGSGKTTLFRILSTLLRPDAGRVAIEGHDLTADPDGIRRALGVVFQSPSLDPLLTVRENLACHGALYGLSGALLEDRIAASLAALGLAERAGDRTATLSGGWKRRAELAKVQMHEPKVLLLDEPTVGLDPGIRREFWSWILGLQKSQGTTVVFTTHLLDEAEAADRVLILDQGKKVAEGTPAELQAGLGGEVLTLVGDDTDALARELKASHGLEAQRVGAELRLHLADARVRAAALLPVLGTRLHSLTVGRPTLEDVFVRATGHEFWNGVPGGVA